MAILRILTKGGEKMEIVVKESVEQVDALIMRREMGRHTKVRLTEPNGKPRLLAIGYPYDIVDNGTVNENLSEDGDQ